MSKINADPTLTQEALNSASKFGETKNGLIKAIPTLKMLGGENIINDAVEKINRYPKIKMAINGMLMLKGSNINNLANELNGQTKQVANTVNSSTSTSFKDRLSKYR